MCHLHYCPPDLPLSVPGITLVLDVLAVQGPVELVVLLLHAGSSPNSLHAQLLQAALRLKAGWGPHGMSCICIAVLCAGFNL